MPFPYIAEEPKKKKLRRSESGIRTSVKATVHPHAASSASFDSSFLAVAGALTPPSPSPDLAAPSTRNHSQAAIRRLGNIPPSVGSNRTEN